MKKILLFSCFLLFITKGIFAQNADITGSLGSYNGLAENESMHARIGNGNSSLGQSFILQNVCGLNWVYGSTLVETRTQPYSFNATGTGLPTSVNISGLFNNTGDTILKAFLYWGTSYKSGPANPAVVSITNPSAVNFIDSARVIGTSGPVCWGEIGTAAYRADITNSISGNGAYAVNITGAGDSAWEVDGVTIIVIYRDSTANYSGSMVLWDGAISSIYVISPQTFTGFNVCSATSKASAFGLMADMQSNTNGNYNSNTFNGSTQSFTNDFWNFNQIATSLSASQSSAVYSTYTNSTGDCYLWLLAGLYWQDSICVNCCPNSLTVTPPTPTICSGSGVQLTASGATYYTWAPATGLSCTTCANPIASPSVTTTYTVTKDSACSKGYVTVTVTQGPVANIYGTSDSNLCDGDAWVHISSGTPPYTYLWSPGGQTTDSIATLCAGNYCCKVSDHTGCYDSLCITVQGVCALFTPSICYVSSDTLSHHNLVVWQKTGIDTSQIDSFIVYRGITSSFYGRIGAVSIHSYSSFIDTGSNPNITSYDYKLGLSDTCRTDTNLSTFHQTVLLQSSLGLGNSINLFWSLYQGAPVNYYRILRDDSGKGNWHVLDSVPGTVNLYTDLTPPLNPGLRYMLNTHWILNCAPSIAPPRRKNRYIFNTNDESYSNISQVTIITGIPVNENPLSVEVYPNPAQDKLYISLKFPMEGTITLSDVLGRQIYTNNISAPSGNKLEEINTHALPSGVYFLKIETGKGQRVIRKVIKI